MKYRVYYISRWRRICMNMVFAADPTITISQDKAKFFKITNLGELISAATGALLIIAALLAFFYLILGGIQWITSGGDKAGMEAARNKITHAVVGLIIVGAAWAIMILVQNFLGVDIVGKGLTFPTPF